MGSEQIAANLSFINWTVLTALAFGSFTVVVFARLRTSATKGFLSFAALSAAGFGFLAWLSDGALPALTVGPVTTDPSFDAPRRAMLAAFTLLALLTMVVIGRGGRGRIPGGLGFAAGAIVLVLGACTWGGLPVDAAWLLVQLTMLSLATGGVFAAMILGHWYLVTPKLPERPLVVISTALLVVIGIQVGLFVVWTGLDIGPGASGGPFSALFGEWALFVWLRLLVGLVFPLIVSWAALQTARTRSMESATGLLYINVGTVAAGTIVAAGLYFGAGLLV